MSWRRSKRMSFCRGLSPVTEVTKWGQEIVFSVGANELSDHADRTTS